MQVGLTGHFAKDAPHVFEEAMGTASRIILALGNLLRQDGYALRGYRGWDSVFMLADGLTASAWTPAFPYNASGSVSDCSTSSSTPGISVSNDDSHHETSPKSLRCCCCCL